MASDEVAQVPCRSKPFIDFEKEELKRIVSKYYSIFKNRKTDSSSLNKKKLAWDAVCTEYNACDVTSNRTVKQLKRAWECMKAQMKKRTPAANCHAIDTGRISCISDLSTDPLEVSSPHLAHFASQDVDCDALSGILTHSNDSTGCSNTIEIPEFTFVDDSPLEIDLDSEVGQDVERPTSVCRSPRPRSAVEKSANTTRSRKAHTKIAVLSDEHQERMKQLADSAKREEALHELRIRESRAAVRAAEFRATREELLLNEAKKEAADAKHKVSEERRKVVEEEEYLMERRRLELDQMREKHELKCRLLEKQLK